MSQQDVERSFAVFPGGSNGEFNLTRELSMVIARGAGCRLWDTAGREYLDFSMGWGSALVGHARPEVTEAVLRQAPLGANFAYVNEQSLALAEEIVALCPAVERMRFCASGTEATMYCLRLARAFTGKSRVLKFEGAYHGAHAVGVTSLFPSRLLDFPEPEPSSAGVDMLVKEQVLIAPFNDIDAVRRILAAQAAEVAAVIVEPLHRCVPPAPGFLEALRAACDEHGVLLIFDEVVTGFRLALGGAQEYYGVRPDLAAYGKALGGGYPIGAFGGRAEIMEQVTESRMSDDSYVWTASTLGGNPVCTAAARAALSVFRTPGAYDHLHNLGHYFRNELRCALDDHGILAQVIGDGPLAQVVFVAHPVTDYRTGFTADRAKGRRLMLALFERGIFLNPMGTKLYLSLAHTEADCDEFRNRFEAALKAI
jgi:glutamate-1-semialdehyde 2,1-aminomutase